MHPNEQVTRICDAVDAWIGNEEGLLEQGRDRTIAEGLFTGHDIDHMVDQIARSVTRDALSSWIKKSRVPKEVQKIKKTDSAVHKSERSVSATHNNNVLCLHAGNLPMVGLQDVIATLLAGACYFGKLSTGDPWLLDGLLQLLQKQLPDHVIKWSTNLDDFKGMQSDRILFAGSEASVGPVSSRLRELGVADESARFLKRTARFSIAFLSERDVALRKEKDVEALRKGAVGAAGLVGSVEAAGAVGAPTPGILNDLAEAIMRYEGRGCRSAAIVVAPCELSEILGVLIPELKKYIRKNSFLHKDNQPGQSYWTSYLKAMDHDFFECGPMLLTDDTDLLGREDVVCWICGGKKTVMDLIGQLGPMVQNIYMTGDLSLPLSEPLSTAQTPAIDWQPDGVDVLRWLCTPAYS